MNRTITASTVAALPRISVGAIPADAAWGQTCSASSANSTNWASSANSASSADQRPVE